MAYITPDDYTVLIRDEIKDVLLSNYSETKLSTAENMAIAQIKNYLSGRYNTDVIFDPLGNRNAHIVMITIDCTLYHLYSSCAPNRIPEHRAARYQDALNWLKDVSRGTAKTDLPVITDENGDRSYPFIIRSEHKNENNRW